MSGSGKYKGLTPFPPDVGEGVAPIAYVTEDECIACERCPPVCFFDALVMEPRPGHAFGATAVVVQENCTGCGLCFEACPVDALVWIPDITI